MFHAVLQSSIVGRHALTAAPLASGGFGKFSLGLSVGPVVLPPQSHVSSSRNRAPFTRIRIFSSQIMLLPLCRVLGVSDLDYYVC